MNVYCETRGLKNEFTYENILPVLSYDYLLSSVFLQQSFIDYNAGEQNIFSSKGFIYYLRSSLGNVLGGFTMKRSVQELLYGYEDPFLAMLSKMNYYAGGDPTLHSEFSLLNNMTNTPMDPTAKWSFYTGKNDSMLTRQYRTSYGADNSNKIK